MIEPAGAECPVLVSVACAQSPLAFLNFMNTHAASQFDGPLLTRQDSSHVISNSTSTVPAEVLRLVVEMLVIWSAVQLAHSAPIMSRMNTKNDLKTLLTKT
jgi:hypothetical protein